MKKTMIALATIAAVGSASAQVTLGGEFAWGYGNFGTAGADASGGGIDTSLLTITAKEDLGGGMAITAKIGLNIGQYGGVAASGPYALAGGPNADDQSLTLTTPMGALTLTTFMPGDWVMGASGSGTWYGLDGRSLAARARRDGYSFTVPVMDGLTVTAGFTEPAGSTGEGAGNAGQTGQGIYAFAGKYATGPVVLQAAYLSLSNGNGTDGKKDSVVRLGATYDMGVAKVGAAYENAKLSGGGTNSETAFALTAPLAANLSIAATYASTALTSTYAAYTGVVGTRNGYQVQAQYNMSKTAYVIASYGAWTGTTTANASAYAMSTTTGLIAQTATSAVATTDSKDSNLMALTLVKDF